MVNYLHEILVKIPTVHTPSLMSVLAPMYASSILSIHLSDNKHQETPEIFPITEHGEKFSNSYGKNP